MASVIITGENRCLLTRREKKMKKLFSALLPALLVFCLVGCSSAEALNEKEQLICDAISDSFQFQDVTGIEIKSGTASDDRAYLTISYTDQSGKVLTSQYKITASSVTDISSIDDKPTTIARYLEMSTMTSDDLDYSKISEYLSGEK